MANNMVWRLSLIITLIVVGGTCLTTAQSQDNSNRPIKPPTVAQDEDGQKGIQSSEVLERPIKPPTKAAVNTSASGAANTKPPAKKPRKRSTYSAKTNFTKAPPIQGNEYVKVGVTIWRVQGDGSKGFEQVGEEAQTLEQVEVGTQLAIGSNVRLGVEPLTRDGYLYIIDREQFADGSYGTPQLIFPTLRTRKGNNLIRAFERLLIPGRPSYFRINPSRMGKMQVAEVLTIIISPSELSLPSPLSDKPMALRAEQFKEWETKWSAPVVELEMEGGAGITTGAKDLGQVGEESQQLTDDDPYPQTVYRASVNKGSPMLVTVPLRFEGLPRRRP